MGSLRMEVHLHLDELLTRVAEATPEALRAGMEHVGEVSAQQCPIEEGTLLRSQQIEPVDDDTVSISYNTPYAVYVEERMDVHHPHGNAKFLGNPMITEADTALSIVARHLRDAL